jgi:hypothetical protein
MKMSLEWEFIGRTPLPPGNMKNIDMWRLKVDGGWILLTLRAVRDVESISTMFYPDPAHSWDVPPPPNAGHAAPPPTAYGGEMGRY